MSKENKAKTETVEPTNNDQPEKPAEKAIEKASNKPGKLAFLKPSNWKATIKRHPRRSIAAGIVLVLLALAFILPMTRYPVLGLVMKKPVEFKLVDSKTNKPLTEATLTVAGKSAKSGADGVVRVSGVKVGEHTFTVTKNYYTTLNGKVFVGLGSAKQAQLGIVSTGRPVIAKVVNAVSRKPVQNALISFGNNQFRTDKDGVATVVLAVDTPEQTVKLIADGFNDGEAKVVATDAEPSDDKNTLALTPAGKVYFLSKRTGKIDVMKSDLDGKNAQVVLAATGFESDTQTILLASRDWKYLALKAKRDNKKDYEALYIIDTQNGDKLITADEGNATFTFTGWLDHTFVYQVSRNDLKVYQPGRQKIKSYAAETKKLTTIDEATAGGTPFNYERQNISNVYLLGQVVIYSKNWYASVSYSTSRQTEILTAKTDGSNKKVIKAWPATQATYLNLQPYEVNEAYIQVEIFNSGQYTNEFYEYSNGAVKTSSEAKDSFSKQYPTPIISPDSKLTFWSEQRDGKGVILLGDASGENEKSIAAVEEAAAYGWYTDNYLLVSKKSSELYIMSVNGSPLLKITDYHKPDVDFYGYGGGYGGF